MKQPYEHKKIQWWRVLSTSFRSLGALIKVWPLLLIAVLLISPITPHMRWQYTYSQHGQTRTYSSCEYLGVNGLVFYREGDNCPFITLIGQR